MKKILFVTSEAHPLIKTGGLADVCGSLPKALAELCQDIKLIIPNYQALKTTENVRFLCSLRVDNRNINILETRMPDSHVIVWLVDYPSLLNYPGNPYVDEQGDPWPNNAERLRYFAGSPLKWLWIECIRTGNLILSIVTIGKGFGAGLVVTGARPAHDRIYHP